jgi:arsenate reductase (thioredoxin)
VTLEMQLYPDWTITLACGAKCPYVPSTVEDWDIADPPGKPIEKVRSIRDDMRIESRPRP